MKTVLIAVLVIFSSAIHALDVTEGNYYVKNFRFNSGEVLPELKLHYITLGNRNIDAQGRTTNAVLLLHGTTGVGRNFLSPERADFLFGPGQPLDVSKYFIIIPDGIGRGGSSKPSNGLKGKFPRYGYHDLVTGNYLVVTEALKIDHLKLILGTSMGGMLGWLWVERYPDMVDAMMPIACLPTAITGRNFMWRNLIIESIRNDPDYNYGDYTKQPTHYQTALTTFNIMTWSAQKQEAVGKTEKQARETFNEWVADYHTWVDANDLLYGMAASYDYNPEPDLGKIKAHVFAVNFDDDLLNPIELGVLQRVMPKVKNGKYVNMPAAPNFLGHQTLLQAKVWAPYLQELLNETDKQKK